MNAMLAEAVGSDSAAPLDAIPQGVERMLGATLQSAGFTAANCPLQIYADAAQTIPYEIAFTPSVDCWWPVSASLLVAIADPIWSRVNGDLFLTPADADGITTLTTSIMDHSQAADWSGGFVRALFKLERGVDYVVRLRIGAISGGGTWVYYRGGQHTWLQSDPPIPR